MAVSKLNALKSVIGELLGNLNHGRLSDKVITFVKQDFLFSQPKRHGRKGYFRN